LTTLRARLRRLVETTIASFALAACTQQPTAPVCTAPLKLALEVVTPRFPDGLSVLNAEGQHRDPSGRIGRERTKLLVVVVFDAPAHQAKVSEVADAYVKRFGQRGVFRVERAVCAGG
jgi:hypothetical protein